MFSKDNIEQCCLSGNKQISTFPKADVVTTSSGKRIAAPFTTIVKGIHKKTNNRLLGPFDAVCDKHIRNSESSVKGEEKQKIPKEKFP